MREFLEKHSARILGAIFGTLIGVIVLAFCLSEPEAAPAPRIPPAAQVPVKCQPGTRGIVVCSVQLEDGTRCVMTTAGGLDCDWGAK